MNWWYIYSLSWGAAVAGGVFYTLWFRSLGEKFDILDHPRSEKHKQHLQAVPKLGGPAMFAGWLSLLVAGLLVLWSIQWLELDWSVLEYYDGVRKRGGQLLIIAAGAAGMLILGLLDDFRVLRPAWKLAVQALICGAVAAFGPRITLFVPLPWFNWLITFLWMLTVVNAVNIFDNMDGMAGGCGVAASFLFFLVAGLQEQYFVALLSALTGGVALGFLIFNWPPAKIFMGDSGSHFLGYMLAVLGVLTTYYSPMAAGTPAALLIPLLILALPLFDLVAVIYLRLRQGVPIYQGDNQHISHRLQMAGLSPAGVAWSVNLLGLALGAGAIPLLWLPARLATVALVQAGAMLALITVLHTARIEKE